MISRRNKWTAAGLVMLLLGSIAGRPGFDISTGLTFSFWYDSCKEVYAFPYLGGFVSLFILLALSIGLMFAFLKLWKSSIKRRFLV
jgi:hypothetical protein